MLKRVRVFMPWAVLLGSSYLSAGEPGGRVATLRVPDRGIQPQVQVDEKGSVHLLYYKGDGGGGDLFYVRSTDGGGTFSSPLQVNSHPGSAVAAGNIRGAHLAMGKSGRAHVAWMGSKNAEPKGPNNASPMLYARLNDAGSAFEPQRNVMQFAEGLDGGGTVAADPAGHVFVFWHANPGKTGEVNRRVFVACSTDEGKTFARETPAFAQSTGCCACCGMGAYADAKGTVYALFRAATNSLNRDMYLLVSKDKGATFQGSDIHPWKVPQCVMSTAGFSETSAGVLLTWETMGQVYFARISPGTLQASPPVPGPGNAKGRKHSAVAGNAAGEVLLAWTEGMGWQKGGSLAWQRYDKNGQPAGEPGRADGVPVWSLVAAFAKPDGSFVILY